MLSLYRGINCDVCLFTLRTFTSFLSLSKNTNVYQSKSPKSDIVTGIKLKETSAVAGFAIGFPKILPRQFQQSKRV